MLRTVTLSALLVTLAVLAGCGQSSADKAKTQVCGARDDIAKQVKQLKGLTLATATTSQVNDSVNAIKSDLSKISDASGDLSDELKSDVQAANQQFSSTVKETAGNLGKSISLQDAASQLNTALDQLAASYQSTFGQIKCS
jgi:phosphoglycerate-specific signal transduction histidine kinase